MEKRRDKWSKERKLEESEGREREREREIDI